jgi:hypothetical protein
MIEQPGVRLAGAEEALRQLSSAVEQALQHQEQLAQELQERAASLFERLRTLLQQPLPGPAPTSSWKTPLSRKPPPASAITAELFELVRSYPKCRYQSLVLRKISSFYVGLRGQMSDQLREVDFCRARLGELATLMGDERAPTGGPGDAPEVLPLPKEAGMYLFPWGCGSLAEAVTQLDRAVTAEELQELDARAQELIRRQFRALVHVCMTPSNVLRSLAPLLRQEVETFLDARVSGIDVLETFLASTEGKEARQADELGDAYDAAAVPLGKDGGADELRLFAVPPGPSEEHFRKLMSEAVPEAALTAADSGADEVVLYRERLAPAPFDLPTFSGPARDAYREALAHGQLTPHSRVDIVEW